MDDISPLDIISNEFINLFDEPIKAKIDSALAVLGKFFKVDRSYIFQYHGEYMSNTNEWVREGITAFIDGLQNIPKSIFSWMDKKMANGEIINLQDIEKLPDDASTEKEEFRKEGIKSILLIPIVINDKRLGFIGLDSVREHRMWTTQEISICQIAGQIILSSIEKLTLIEELRSSEGRYRTILELIPDTIAIHRNGVLIYINPAGRKLMKVEHEDELIGKNIIEFVHPEDRPMVLQRVRGAQQGIVQPLTTERFIRNDGSIVFVETVALQLEFEGEDANLVVVRDISERVETQRKLVENERKFRMLFEKSFDAIYISTVEGKFIEVNEAMQNLLGYTKEELLDIDVRILYSDPKFRDRFASIINEKGMVKDVQVQIIHKSGKLLHCLESSSALFNDEQEIVGYQGIIRDMSEIIEARETIFRMQKEESLGTMASGIAHDFNNYLTVISGNASLLENRLEDPDLRETVQTMIQVTNKASELISQLLEYTGNKSVERSALSINEIVEMNKNMIRLASLQSIELTYDLCPENPMIMASSGQLSQILLNLVTNATEAIKEENGSIRIRTRCVYLTEGDTKSITPYTINPGRYVAIEVIDNGEGISKDTIEKIFDPFFTTKFTGRGLGLPSVLGIVKSMGGGIRLQSEQGSGTKITIYIPEYHPIPSEEEDYVDEVQKKKPDLTGMKVLICDDEEDNRVLFGKFFELLSASVVFAEDGVNCLEVIEQEKIDLLLLDIIMPRMTGHEVFKRLREKNPDLPIIVCSGFSKDSHRYLYEQKTAFLGKPFTFEDLNKTIRKLLDLPHSDRSS